MSVEQDESRSVHITVNGENIPLNPFVHNFMARTIEGMIEALKNLPSPVKTITISIEKK